jgi:hypothetical protein
MLNLSAIILGKKNSSIVYKSNYKLSYKLNIKYKSKL